MENKKQNTNLIKLNKGAIPEEIIESKILFLRGKKVILDSDLAMLYEVETKQLKRAVKRNLDRFPEDFMFELTREESEILRCQFGTLRWGEHSKYLPYAFSEHGILMLSSVLNSDRAIQTNIQIMRIFIRIRQILVSNQDIKKKIEKIDNKLLSHDSQLQMQAFLIDATIKKVNKSGKKEKENVILGFRDRQKKSRNP